MKRLLLVALTLIICTASSTHSEAQKTAKPTEKKSIAVSIIKTLGKIDPSMGPLVTGLLTHDLTDSTKLEVINSPELTEEVLRIMETNTSDLCDQTKCQVAPGQFIQIQKLVTGELSLLGSAYILTIRVIDVETGKIDLSKSEQCPDEKNIRTLITRMAYHIRNRYGEKLKLPEYGAGSELKIGGESKTGPDKSEAVEISPPEVVRSNSNIAALYITTIPSGAEVYLNGTRFGQTDPAFQYDSLEPGQKVQVTIKKQNYHDLVFNVEVVAGITKYKDLKLKPAFGTLSITSDPPGATVFVAGKEVGKTPYTNDRMPSGKHLVRVTLDLYEKAEKQVEVQDEAITSENFKLKENFGTLMVEAGTPGALVKINGKDQGEVPQRLRLKPGEYQLSIVKPGYDIKEFKITIAKGETLTIAAEKSALVMQTGAIFVFADPPQPGARVQLDGVDKGEAPVSLEQVPVGKHKVTVIGKVGKQEVEVEVVSGQTHKVKVDVSKPESAPMAKIPSGCFMMGDHFNEGYEDELPTRQVCFSKDFYMDTHEVTNGKYETCVKAGKCTAPGESKSYTRSSYYGNPKFKDFPVVYVDWNQATDYCTWAGGRLPSETEWEYAARGGLEGKRYPWGNDIDKSKANYDSHDTIRVGQYPSNGYGLYDMAGNVWEWTADWESLGIDDPSFTLTESRMILRGGGWGSNPDYLRVSVRGIFRSDKSGEGTGFRCARD